MKSMPRLGVAAFPTHRRGYGWAKTMALRRLAQPWRNAAQHGGDDKSLSITKCRDQTTTNKGLFTFLIPRSIVWGLRSGCPFGGVGGVDGVGGGSYSGGAFSITISPPSSSSSRRPVLVASSCPCHHQRLHQRIHRLVSSSSSCISTITTAPQPFLSSFLSFRLVFVLFEPWPAGGKLTYDLTGNQRLDQPNRMEVGGRLDQPNGVEIGRRLHQPNGIRRIRHGGVTLQNGMEIRGGVRHRLYQPSKDQI